MVKRKLFWFPLKCRVKVSVALANKGGYQLMLRIEKKLIVVDDGD